MSRRYTICHKTEVVKNTLDPVWQAFKIPVRALCNGDYDRYGTMQREACTCKPHPTVYRKLEIIIMCSDLLQDFIYCDKNSSEAMQYVDGKKLSADETK